MYEKAIESANKLINIHFNGNAYYMKCHCLIKLNRSEELA